MAKVCDMCNMKIPMGGICKMDGKVICPDCRDRLLEEERLANMPNEDRKREYEKLDNINGILMTSTNNIDGFRVKKYICIESVEIVIGTGVFSEISTGIEDLLGERSTAFENKLGKAKETAFKKLRINAAEKGGNAVIGIDIDYTEFTSNRIGLIANGTVVEIEKCESHFDSICSIRELHELMADGIISIEEFNEKKEILMSKIN